VVPLAESFKQCALRSGLTSRWSGPAPAGRATLALYSQLRAAIWLRPLSFNVGQQERHLVRSRSEDYRPPQSRAELEERYAAGERFFPETDLSGCDLSGIVLDGADFEKHS